MNQGCKIIVWYTVVLPVIPKRGVSIILSQLYQITDGNHRNIYISLMWVKMSSIFKTSDNVTGTTGGPSSLKAFKVITFTGSFHFFSLQTLHYECFQLQETSSNIQSSQFLPKSLCALSCNAGQIPVSKLAGLGFLGMCGSGSSEYTDWLERFWPWGSDTFLHTGTNRDGILSCGYSKAALLKWGVISQISQLSPRAKMKQ